MKEDKSKLLDTDKLEEDLKLSKGDATAAVTKATLSLIPYLGGPAVELFGAVTTPMLSKRRDKWIVMFADAINELMVRMDESSFEKLPENEMFITTVMHASQIAIRNHQEEKLIALKNAVLNSALENAPEEDLQLMFLDLVDSFTSLHLKLLNFFNEPELKKAIDNLIQNTQIELNPMKYNFGDTLEVTFPELKGKNYIYQKIIKDLESQGMIITEYSNVKIESNGNIIPGIQYLGESFLSFITSP